MKKIYIVGMGPGKYDQMTIEAVKKIEESDVVIGYTVYTDLIKEIWPDKNCLSTPTCLLGRCRSLRLIGTYAGHSSAV